MATPFERAVAHVGSSGVQTDNQTKLRLYALYKVATVLQRPAKGSRPGMFDFTGRAKWDAWDRLGSDEGMDAQVAQVAYVQLAKERFDFREDDSASRAQQAESSSAEHEQRKPQPKKEQMVGVSMMTDDFVDEAPPSRIHELAIDGDATALQAFLASESGATVDLNVRDSYGYTPLHLATDRGQTEAVKVLLGAGADRSLKDDDGNTALDLARLAEHEDIAALLA